MRLIINIPEEEYNRIQKFAEGNTLYSTTLILYDAVRKGEPYDEPYYCPFDPDMRI